MWLIHCKFMRILFCHENFPGSFAFMGESLARNNEVLFASLHQRRGAAIPNVRRILVRSDQQRGATSYAEIWQESVGAGKSRVAFWKKIHDDFQPDWLLYSFCGGIGFFLHEIFSDAFRVFYPALKGEHDAKSGALRDLQILPVIKSNLCFAFSEGVKKAFPNGVNNRITIIRPWLECKYLSPGHDEESEASCGKTKNLAVIDLRHCETAPMAELRAFIDKAVNMAWQVCVLLGSDCGMDFANPGVFSLRDPILKDRRKIFFAADFYFNPRVAPAAFLEPMACGCPVFYSREKSGCSSLPFCKAVSAPAWSEELLALVRRAPGRLPIYGAKACAWVKARYGDTVLVPAHIKTITEAWLRYKENFEYGLPQV